MDKFGDLIRNGYKPCSSWFESMVKKLKYHKDIDEFYLSDVDLYGIQTALDEEGIAKMVLGTVEEVMV